MFGMVAANGIRTLGKVDFAARPHDLLIVSVSLALAMVPVVGDHVFDRLPHALGPLLHSGILLATVSAVVLNAWFNGIGSSAET